MHEWENIVAKEIAEEIDNEILSIFAHVKKHQDEDFSPERMREAARILRLASNVFVRKSMKDKCETYAKMLDRLSVQEEYKREEFRKQDKLWRKQWKEEQEAKDSW